jgi:hypothetical protein
VVGSWSAGNIVGDCPNCQAVAESSRYARQGYDLLGSGLRHSAAWPNCAGNFELLSQTLTVLQIVSNVL